MSGPATRLTHIVIEPSVRFESAKLVCQGGVASKVKIFRR